MRKIRIERFRGFEELEAELHPTTVVVGPNSSGKTTLLYAIQLALKALDDGLHAGSSRLAREGAEDGWIEVVYGALIGDHTRYLSVADWQALFHNQRVGDSERLSIALSFDQGDRIREIKVDVRCGRSAQIRLDIWICSPELAARLESLSKRGGAANREIVDYVGQHGPQAVLVPSFYGVVREEEYRAGVVVDRLLGAGDQSHIVRNLVSRLSADALTRLNAFLTESLGARIVERTAAADSESVYPLVVRFRDEDGPLELSAAGAGLINLIALYAALERFRSEQRQRSVIFLLDEPEAHLHPRLQGEMAERVTSLIVREFGSQVVMATHAVEIVNRLFRREDTAVLRVDRGAQRVSLLQGQSEVVAELGEWADLTPFSLINFLASRQILFYEGESDRIILEGCARLRFRTDLVRRDRFESWTLAPLLGSGNDKLARLLQRLVDSQLISGLSSGAPLKVMVVLDQDYEREPGVHEEPSEGRVQGTRVVWPMHSIESLFLRREVLSAWLKARWGADTPSALGQWIDDALAAADEDDKLLRAAESQLLAKIISRGIPGKDGQPLRSEQLSKHAHRLAVERVAAEPSKWQRGHDRGRFVLGKIRARLPAKLDGHFPSNIHALIETTPLDQVGAPDRAIPAELRELLELMVAPPPGAS
nr:ATP-binding protein [Pseudenhygromyxa sp. WMMC2535]